jgi:hypothetical protein
MRRGIPRALPALLVSFTLPAAAGAQQPPPAATPPPPPAATAPPPAAAPGTPVLAPGVAGPVTGVPTGAVYYPDAYHAATPYNPTVTGQTIPNPAWNRPVTTLPCGWPNQNFDAFVPPDRGCGGCGGHGWLRKGGCGGGCDGGCDGGCGGGKHGLLHGGCAGACSKGGSCTTCCNTSNFAFGSSRSFFGESSREFFERPPSPDGIKMVPVKYAPPPAPAAYVPATVIVPVARATP